MAINMDGAEIDASGGPGGADSGGNGSGGAVRLMAPTINVTTSQTGRGSGISVAGGQNVSIPAPSGFARLEAFTLNIGPLSIAGNSVQSTPNNVVIPATPPPYIYVASVAGMPVIQGVFPDVSIDSTGSVPVVIRAQCILTGTIPTLYILSESGPDQKIPAPPLSGTLASSTSTVNVTYSPKGSYGFVKVTWKH